MRLDGKTAVVTGAASGIGKATAITFARDARSASTPSGGNGWPAEATSSAQPSTSRTAPGAATSWPQPSSTCRS